MYTSHHFPDARLANVVLGNVMATVSQTSDERSLFKRAE